MMDKTYLNSTAYKNENGNTPVVSYNDMITNTIDDVVKMFADNNVSYDDAIWYLVNQIQKDYRDIEGLHSGIKGRQDNVNRLVNDNIRLKKKLAMHE